MIGICADSPNEIKRYVPIVVAVVVVGGGGGGGGGLQKCQI